MKHLLILTLAFLSILSACKKDSSTTTKTTSSVVIKNLAADPTPATGKFTFFRLKDSSIVANTDSATNKWDIGFRSTTIIINGGTDRVGNGGAYVYDGIFDNLTEIPADLIFNEDQSSSILAIPIGSGNGWYTYSMTTYTVSPIAGKTILIRTADGKYAKLEILSYYKDAPTTPTTASTQRYYTFRYVYQSDGTRKF